MHEVRSALYEALCKRYDAEHSQALATLMVYAHNPVGIGEHPQHLDEMDKLLEKAKSAQDKLDYLVQNHAKLVLPAASTPDTTNIPFTIGPLTTEPIMAETSAPSE